MVSNYHVPILLEALPVPMGIKGRKHQCLTSQTIINIYKLRATMRDQKSLIK